ncbi:cell wall macromolecule catabolic process [Spatholobus suberectus]|nr:cell wall macromolecule catabolic process [Spatholobus suberectus]
MSLNPTSPEANGKIQHNMGSSAATKTIADSASWCCAMVLLAMILLGSIRESTMADEGEAVKGNNLRERPCDEIYVVGEGETLHTISDKCNDPFIVERNPHIHDPDDVFPGLVIKITPTNTRKLLKR